DCCFFFQAEDGIRDFHVTGVQTCALPISLFIRAGAAARFAGQIVKVFDVRTPSVSAAAASLSGGNLQKFIVGREILQRPTVLVRSEERRVGKEERSLWEVREIDVERNITA